MTMIATVLGGLPLILRGGAGSEMRVALGWIIVGGLGFATLFTLFLTPVAFSLLARYAKPRAHHEQRLVAARTEDLARRRRRCRELHRLTVDRQPSIGAVPHHNLPGIGHRRNARVGHERQAHVQPLLRER